MSDEAAAQEIAVALNDKEKNPDIACMVFPNIAKANEWAMWVKTSEFNDLARFSLLGFG